MVGQTPIKVKLEDMSLEKMAFNMNGPKHMLTKAIIDTNRGSGFVA